VETWHLKQYQVKVVSKYECARCVFLFYHTGLPNELSVPCACSTNRGYRCDPLRSKEHELQLSWVQYGRAGVKWMYLPGLDHKVPLLGNRILSALLHHTSR